MKRWTSFPTYTPNWLLRHPLLLAEWLALNNVLRRMFADRPAAGIRSRVIVLACAAVTIIAVVALGSRAGGVLESLLDYWVITVAVVALYAAAMVARSRRLIARRHPVSWLASTAIAARSVRLSHVFKSLFAPTVASMAVVVAIFVSAALSDVSFLLAAKLAACVASGATAGMLVGWWWRTSRSTRTRFESSHYVPHATSVQSPTPSLLALSRWPISQMRAWGRPENARVFVLVALSSVNGGTSAMRGIAIISAWLLAGYLGGLLTALLQSARAAAVWMRSTPLHFYQFAWAMAHRALAHQLIGTAVAGGLMLTLGIAPAGAAYLCVMWLTIVVLASVVGLVESYRSRSSAAAVTLSLTVMLAVESRQQGWSIPLAALFVAWRLRGGARE